MFDFYLKQKMFFHTMGGSLRHLIWDDRNVIQKNGILSWTLVQITSSIHKLESKHRKRKWWILSQRKMSKISIFWSEVFLHWNFRKEKWY